MIQASSFGPGQPRPDALRGRGAQRDGALRADHGADPGLAEHHVGALVGVVGVDGHVRGTRSSSVARTATYRSAVPDGIADADPVAVPDAARGEGGAEGVDLAQQRGVVEHLTAVVDGCGARVCPGGGLEDVAQGALRRPPAEVDRREGRAFPGGRGRGGAGPAVRGGGRGRRPAGAEGSRGACAGSAPGRAAPASSPDRRRVRCRTAAGDDGHPFGESLGRGNRTAPGYARCAAGRAGVARTCVLAGSPGGRIGATTGMRDVTPSDSEVEAPFGCGRTTGTRDVWHSGLRRGAVRASWDNREARCPGGPGRASRGSARAAGPERPAPGSYAHPVRCPDHRPATH